ncbi:hypothetical protein TrCOL_g13050 [Triparma columacea]|uniref:N-acetyltransferase domain-containing protein n=2 Tax=Triparma columacea TaxID=722753 RepID=A0A9W7G1S5_9STRA|nr:hypothetical protein TrCOL_g13050 [Triparma columacea]
MIPLTASPKEPDPDSSIHTNKHNHYNMKKGAIKVCKFDPKFTEGLAAAANYKSLASSLRVGFPSPYQQKHAADFITKATRDDGEINRCILMNDQVAGVVSAWRGRSIDPSVWEIGYWVSPPLQGLGLATEAVRTIVEELGGGRLGRIEASVRVCNSGSRRVLEKNGFVKEGITRGLDNGVDCVTYGLFRRGGGRGGKVRGDFVHYADGGLDCFEDYICEWEKGRITRFEKAEEGAGQPPPPRSGGVFTPGLIDLHNHAPQHAFKGTGLDKPLMGPGGWLESYTFRAEKMCCDDLERARLTFREAVTSGLRNGTTTAVYFGVLDAEASKVLADVMIEEGQRGWASKVSMDRNAPGYYVEDTAEGLSRLSDFVDHVVRRGEECDGRVRPALCPRFIPTCSPEMLRGIEAIRREHPGGKMLVTSHLSESVDEVDFVKTLHQGEGSDADIFDAAGLLHDSIQAHCVHCCPKDWVKMRDCGSAVAHCPLSNFYFAGGTLDVRAPREAGVRVGLGTDVAGGYDGSILSAARHAVIAARVCGGDLAWWEAFGMATAGGAEALGMEGELGKFGVGFRMDAVCWEGERREDGIEGYLEWIVHKGDDRNIRAVYVDGRQVV